MALVEQQQQESSKKKTFFVLRKKGTNNMWLPISYIDSNGSFRGQAVFEDLYEAVNYQKKYEESLIKRYLEEIKM